MSEDFKCDPKTVCRGLGIHYHCVKCTEATGMMGHIIPDSVFGDPKFTCEKESNE